MLNNENKLISDTQSASVGEYIPGMQKRAAMGWLRLSEERWEGRKEGAGGVPPAGR